MTEYRRPVPAIDEAGRVGTVTVPDFDSITPDTDMPSMTAVYALKLGVHEELECAAVGCSEPATTRVVRLPAKAPHAYACAVHMMPVSEAVTAMAKDMERE